MPTPSHPGAAGMPRRLVLVALLLSPGRLLAEEPVDYARQVRPLLKERCYSCHGALKQQGKLRVDSGKLILQGGRHGAAIKPGSHATSLLIERVTDADEASRMPPEGKPLSEAQVAVLKRWIDEGARVPADERPETDPRDHWAFRKPTRPPPPDVGDPAWAANPVDRFVAAAHAKHGLTASPPADQATLLRRVYLDLIGLPPTRRELHDFLADASPDAYERVVDRLLARPEYAERWARHWMDVWRYSDWYGRRSVPDVLNSYPMVWRWRDWIVRSLDEDRGYDGMIVDMLAADEVAPDEDSRLVATGFIVRNCFRWNYEQWKKDLVEHTSKAFLGLTLNCCHCHDHKYDPVSQEEYFRFRAFFEPLELRHDRVPGEPDPGPYPKYVYGQSHKPIASGMVRVFDEVLDAATYMYSGGDHRNRMPGKPPVEPGTPAVLGGQLRIEPVSLPTKAWFPGIKPFVRHDEIGRREQATDAAEASLVAARAGVMAAEKHLADAPSREWDDRRQALDVARLAVASAEAQWVAAQADLVAIRTRLDADDAKYRGSPVRPADAAKLASKAERRAKHEAAVAARAKALHDLTVARRKPADAKTQAEVKQREQQLATAEQAVAGAQKALAGDSTVYTSLSPVYPPRSTGRRTALAKWIASSDNPLTARVAMNYVWGWHFGRPLVDSTFDFGRNGKAPSHPELLDWLAVEFMEQGWQFKPLHRLIVRSRAYRMRSDLGGDVNHPNLARDADNRFLWRFPTGRMEAEMVRDGLLYLAGDLDPKRGGPEIPIEQGQTSPRRSLYFAHHGEARMPFLELFDAANACDAYKRSTSVVPQQALALNNSDLSLRMARKLARTLATESAEDAFIRATFEQVLGRAPGGDETAASVAFLSRQRGLFEKSGLKGGTPPTTGPATDPALRARENLVHALFNHNDFVTIR